MQDAGKIIFGVGVFLILLTSPIWYNLASGQSGYRVEPDLAPARAMSQKLYGKEVCVRAGSLMKTDHMQMLIHWRDQVVREGLREITGDDGSVFKMSLSNTCLGCHTNKAEFCDRCHAYADVTPTCWDCHTDPNSLGAQVATEATAPAPLGQPAPPVNPVEAPAPVVPPAEPTTATGPTSPTPPPAEPAAEAPAPEGEHAGGGH